MAGDRSRLFWILCTLCGAGVLAFAVWFGGVIPARTCSGPLPRGVSALLAYQLARTPADVEAVFGAAGSPCRATMVTVMDRANTVDLTGFIVTYTAFLACFFLALRRIRADAIARLGLAAVFAAALFDVLETATQLHITDRLPGSAAALMLLTIGSRGKFLALAVVCVCAGLATFVRGRPVGRAAGVLCMAGGLLVIGGLLSVPARAALTAGNAIAWIVMLLYAAQAALRLP
jgi:hypothetical protein